jgi:hypothetical protein
MPEPNSLNRSLVAFEQDSTLVAVIDMGQSSWLVVGKLRAIVGTNMGGHPTGDEQV